MATRSLVGIENRDGTITLIYVHHDGYFTGVGRALLTHYTTEAHVRALMRSGDHTTLDRPEPWDGAYGDGSGPCEGATRWPNSMQQYIYLYRGGEWLAREWSAGDEFAAALEWRPLRECVEEEAERLRARAGRT